MRLKTIYAENFRNLKSATVDLQQGLNVLVGPNNAGKTNLFDAIRHALGSSSSQPENLWLEEEDIYRSTNGEPISDPIYIQLTFSELDEIQRAHFFEVIDFSPGVPIESCCARLNFEAKWLKDKRRFGVSRWGGARNGDRSLIPPEILSALPLTYLPALRDAEAALTPGNRSILARVLNDLATRDGEDYQQNFEGIFGAANEQLEKERLIQTLETRLRAAVQGMAGTGYTRPSVRAAPPTFGRIVRMLRVILDEAPVTDLSRSGLGFNNLLFIGTVLAYLEKPRPEECPILLVEEPEAHLSPQHTVLLAAQLSQLVIPQVLVSTHSPTFATQVLPSQVLMLHEKDGLQRCHALKNTGMDKREERQLQRMLDITRATLYFAKGIILVEGISEALLLPELARLQGIELADRYVSVIPISGVSFGTFKKLFTTGKGLEVPVAIITDADPPIHSESRGDWRSEVPQIGQHCPRLTRLRELFEGSQMVGIFRSQVTLEYDLAYASEKNAELMAKTWETTFSGTPSFTSSDLANLKSNDARALQVWRHICRAPNSGSKADFAHMLAETLAQMSSEDRASFAVPDYIVEAIQHSLGVQPHHTEP